MHPVALRLNCTGECPRDVPPLIALPSGSFRPRALYTGLFRRFVFPLTTAQSTPASVVSARSVRQLPSSWESWYSIPPVGPYSLPPASVKLGVLVRQLPSSWGSWESWSAPRSVALGTCSTPPRCCECCCRRRKCIGERSRRPAPSTPRKRKIALAADPVVEAIRCHVLRRSRSIYRERGTAR